MRCTGKMFLLVCLGQGEKRNDFLWSGLAKLETSYHFFLIHLCGLHNPNVDMTDFCM